MKDRKILLHHFAYNIKPNTLEKVQELFKFLGCVVTYQSEGKFRWCMFGQKNIPVDIQLTEKDYDNIKIEKKKYTHIAFLSENPIFEISKIENWAKKNNLKFETGGWNDNERWFDFPELFVNFVVEIMSFSVVEQSKK